MSKMNAMALLEHTIKYLDKNDDLDSEMEIYGRNLSKLNDVRKSLINIGDSRAAKIIDIDAINIQKFVMGEHITTTSIETLSGDYKDFVVDSTNDFNQRIDAKEMTRLGVIYFLMLTVDLDAVLGTNRGIIPLAVNAMRNRSYAKLKPLIKTLLHNDLVERLDQYITINNGDDKDRARIIYLKLSQAINKKEGSFKSKEEVDNYIAEFMESDVNPRIGEPINKKL